MDDGTDRYWLVDWVDADIANRQLPNHRNLAIDLSLTEVADIEVDIVAVGTLEGATGFPFLDEGLRETIPGTQLHSLFLWVVGIVDIEGLTQVVVLEITSTLLVDQDSALAPSGLGDQDAGAG